MCGIAGIFSFANNNKTVDEDELLAMRDSMLNRGPDGEGLWISGDKTVGLAHRRLSIIDLSETGSQPMHSADGTLHIVFNGEIYNYQDIRNYLKQKGFNFRSTSDTEALLYLYKDKGAKMTDDLRGMYSFAVYDQREKSLFLARDPFGIKPLYFSDDGKAFKFASQVKALLGCREINTSIEPAGHVGFFLWGSVPEPYTLYKGIRSLKPGSSLYIDSSGKSSEKIFCSVSEEISKAETYAQKKDLDIKAELLSALLDTVRYHMVSDVPVGLFLSSGLDSAAIAALSAGSSSNTLNSITLGFSEYRGTIDDETVLAEKLSVHYRTRHETKWIAKKDFESESDRFFKAMDQPTIDGLNMYFVSKIASESGMKVALSGLGGDELFGGYPGFRDIPLISQIFKPFHRLNSIGKIFRVISAPAIKHFSSPKYAGLLEYGGSWGGAYFLRRGLFMPWELPELIDPDMAMSGWESLQPLISIESCINGIKSDRLRVSALEMNWYMRNQLLRDADWAGMAHSLEIRVPFVDINLLRKVASLIAAGYRVSKQDMASALQRQLPEAILSRPKTGFSVPIRQWIMGADNNRGSERGLRGWAKAVYKSGFNA